LPSPTLSLSLLALSKLKNDPVESQAPRITLSRCCSLRELDRVVQCKREVYAVQRQIRPSSPPVTTVAVCARISSTSQLRAREEQEQTVREKRAHLCIELSRPDNVAVALGAGRALARLARQDLLEVPVLRVGRVDDGDVAPAVARELAVSESLKDEKERGEREGRTRWCRRGGTRRQASR